MSQGSNIKFYNNNEKINNSIVTKHIYKQNYEILYESIQVFSSKLSRAHKIHISPFYPRNTFKCQYEEAILCLWCRLYHLALLGFHNI